VIFFTQNTLKTQNCENNEPFRLGRLVLFSKKKMWITANLERKNLWITANLERKNLWITAKYLTFAAIFNKLSVL